MGLKSMAYSEKEKKEYIKHATVADAPEFPWGLELRLEKEQLDKLGLEGDVGAEVAIVANGRIVSKSASESTGGGGHKSMTIQIEAMEALSKGSEEQDPESFLQGVLSNG